MKKVILYISIMLLFIINGCAAQSTKNSVSDILKAHNQTIHILKDQWMRDPFITLAPDGYYYLTFTSQPKDLPDQLPAIKFLKSKDLINWESMGLVWDYKDSEYGKAIIEKGKKENKEAMIWAPEAHFINGKWVIVNTSNQNMANIMIAEGNQLKGPWKEPFGANLGSQHDPSVFVDDDKSAYLLSRNGAIQKFNQDFTTFDGKMLRIEPSNRKMGHEGMYMIKLQDKYVLFGTAWSTDNMRSGTYNLYYAIADEATGPFGPRQFAGRFLGHGTPFKDKNGKWWCTAFSNGRYVKPTDLQTVNVTDGAYSINPQGLTLVPMDIYIKEGKVVVKILDPDYTSPGEEEIQKFD